MGKGFKMGGGGTLLPFKVVGGTATPSAPMENTIWVNTDESAYSIHAWDFSAQEPRKRSRNRNLIVSPYDAESKTVNGITYTASLVAVTANGTASSSAYFKIVKSILLKPGTYTLSGCPAGGSAGTYRIIMQPVSKGSAYSDTGSGKTFTLTEETEYSISCWIGTGAGAVADLVFKPQLEPGTAATSYIRGRANGQIWIKTGLESPVEFNALKKDCLQVCPIACYQWEEGAWTLKTAKTWQNGAWVEWDKYLYNYGTCGYTWETVAKEIENASGAGSAAPTITTDSAGAMKIQQSGDYDGGIAYLPDKVDLREYKTLTFSGVLSEAEGDHPERAMLCIWSAIGTYIKDNLAASQKAPVNGVVTIDISALSGSYYIGFGLHHTGSFADVNYIKLSA